MAKPQPQAKAPAAAPSPAATPQAYTPVHIAQPSSLRPQGKTITPRSVRRTVCPSSNHDARYQVPPGAKVVGAGFAAAGIGIDPSTGRPWAR